MKPAGKAALLGALAYVATLGAAAVASGAIMLYLQPKGCNAMSRALLVLWATIAACFLVSVGLVGALVWRLELATAGRLGVLASYAGALFVSFLVIAFSLMLAFNC